MASPKVKKRFGQHFITDPGIARKVAEVLVHPGELYWDLVEVGPGKGMLTQAFQEAFQDRVRLWGIEVDEHWHQLLLRTFPSLDGRLFRESILKLDFQTLLGGQPFGLVGNLPYNIASQIILKAVESRQVVPEIAGTFQLEVAQRLIAEPCNRQYARCFFSASAGSLSGCQGHPGAPERGSRCSVRLDAGCGEAGLSAAPQEAIQQP